MIPVKRSGDPHGERLDLGGAACLLTALERRGIFRAFDLLHAAWRDCVPHGEKLVLAAGGVEVTSEEVRLKFDTQITLTLPRPALSRAGVVREGQADATQEQLRKETNHEQS